MKGINPDFETDFEHEHDKPSTCAIPMSLTIRPATSNDTAWYLDLVRSLATEPEPQIPLGPDEHFRTPEQQAELFGGASARGDLFLILGVGIGNRQSSVVNRISYLNRPSVRHRQPRGR